MSVFDHHRDLTYQYVEDPTLVENITEDDLIYGWDFLAWDLEEWYYQGYSLITKNGNLFDLPIIMKAIEDGGCGLEKSLNYFMKPHAQKKPNMVKRNFHLSTLIFASICVMPAKVIVSHYKT